MTEQPEKKPRKWKRVLLITLGAVFACVVVAIIVVIATGAGRDTERLAANPRPTRTPRPTKTPIPTATPKPIEDVDFFAVRDKQKDMTDAQRKPYLEGLEGKRVEWTGYVEEVKDNGKIWVDMDPPEELLSVQDCYIYVPEEDALLYNKDQQVTWRGDIKRASVVLGSMSIDFEDVVIVSR